MNQDPSSGVCRVCLPDVDHGQSVAFVKEMKNPHLLLPLSDEDVRVGRVRVCVVKLIRSTSDRSMHPSHREAFSGGGR